ncbi:DEAH-box ATP-dependent RNA helicase prp43 [Hypoxylon texense]
MNRRKAGSWSPVPNVVKKRHPNSPSTSPRKVMDAKLGQEVDFNHLFKKTTDRITRLQYVTDGGLARDSVDDPNFSKYSCIVIDIEEAQTRSLDTEFLLGLLKQTISRRKDQKVVIMPTILEAEHFAQFFGNPPII